MRVSPKRPLEVLEMDIKFQWITEKQCYAFIPTVIDCFTRKALYWTVAHPIKQAQIKAVWEQIIIQELQPAGLLERELTLELRNDNDTRFAAKKVQAYFAENHINQVFTHPYTLQENGHIKSFHAILGRSLEIKEYQTINDLEKQLEHFYYIYNNVRLHGSLSHLNPNSFIKLWKHDMILVKPHKKIKHKYNIELKIPHYQIKLNGEFRNLSEETSELLAHGIRRISTLNN
jgi:putative transposase